MRWYRRFFRRGIVERQPDAELRFHLDQRVADLVAIGIAPEPRAARIGGLDRVKEECRDVGAAHSQLTVRAGLDSTTQESVLRRGHGQKGETLLASQLTSLSFAMFLAAGFPTVSAQNAPDPYTIGTDIIIASKKSCPCRFFIGSVAAKSPAESAGIRAGDRLCAADGKGVKGMRPPQVAKLIRSDHPGQVRLRLWRKGKEYEVAVQREKYSSIVAGEGMMRAGPFLVPLDTTEAEVKRMMEIENEQRPIVGRAFPLHYPLNADLYYGGFEIFIFAHPPRVAVGGLEQGAASRAGIHQGDVILSVNGVDPTGKSPQELEALFSSTQPKSLRLVVDRVTTTKTIEFQLERASDVLKENHRRLVDGTVVPDGVANEDIPCFTEKSDN